MLKLVWHFLSDYPLFSFEISGLGVGDTLLSLTKLICQIKFSTNMRLIGLNSIYFHEKNDFLPKSSGSEISF
jgi:hypothetical protein